MGLERESRDQSEFRDTIYQREVKLNETLLTKPADFSGYSPGGLGGDGLPEQDALEPSGSFPYQLGLVVPSRQPRCRRPMQTLRPEALRPHLSVSMRIDGGYYA